jgi:hypothetical protein
MLSCIRHGQNHADLPGQPLTSTLPRAATTRCCVGVSAPLGRLGETIVAGSLIVTNLPRHDEITTGVITGLDIPCYLC